MSQTSGRSPKPKAKAAAKAKTSPPAKRPEDVVLIHGVSADGDAMAVLRARDDRVEAGIMRPAKEGEPLDGELVKLKPRAEFPLLCDVEVQVPAGTINAAGASEAKLAHGGPAQVATPAYRANWDAIWNKSRGGKKSMPN